MSLAFLQKYKSILKNTIYVYVLYVLQRVSGLATVYVLVRTLDQELFGNYQFILSVVSILTIFALPGLNNAVMQSVARGYKGTFGASIKPSFLFSLAGSLILIAIGTWHLIYGGDDLYIAFYLSAFLFPFAHSLKNWKAVIAGEEKFLSLLKIEGLFSILTAVMIIGISLAKPGFIIWPLIIVLAVPSIQNIFYTIYTVKKIGSSAPVEEGSITYGIKTTVYSSFNIVANNIDKLLIFFFISPTSLALFFVAERMAELTKSIVQNIAAVLAPHFAKMETYTDRLDKVLSIFTFGLGAGIVVFAFILLPLIMEILFGETYSDAIPYAQALLCSVAIGNHASLRNRFVSSKLDEKSNRDITITMSLIRIIASIILVPLYGIIGAIISTFIYRISSVMIIHYIIKSRYK